MAYWLRENAIAKKDGAGGAGAVAYWLRDSAAVEESRLGWSWGGGVRPSRFRSGRGSRTMVSRTAMVDRTSAADADRLEDIPRVALDALVPLVISLLKKRRNAMWRLFWVCSFTVILSYT